MNTTQWRKIKGSYGRYEISNTGLLRRSDNRKHLKRMQLKDQQYYYVDISVYGVKKRIIIHKAVMRNFVGNPTKAKPHINHIDGNRINNRLSNLEYCSPSENMAHAYRIGLRSASGDKNGRSKITERQALSIIRSNMDAQSLAAKYNLSVKHVMAMKKGTFWPHLQKINPN